MKRISGKLLISFLLIFMMQQESPGQNPYHNYRSLTDKISALAAAYPGLCSVKSVVKTGGGREIWVMTIGTGDRDNKPGIAVFGGVSGAFIAGREIACGFAARLLKESATGSTPGLLDKVTFYIFPDVSPDASEQYFSGLAYERTGNSRSTDDDRDFADGEDGPEDLNGDGMITLMRIEDPTGKFIRCPEDERIMSEADASKGQTGRYLVYTEGIDNDGDGKFNEDGQGGVSFNRNFPFDYEFYGQQSGLYPVSEPETKAVADFLFERFNIYAVFMFGPQDNLGQPLKASPADEKTVLVKAVREEDEQVGKLVSERYHAITGLTGTPTMSNDRGNFMNWVYFHYGRYSFSTPGWWYDAGKDKNAQAEFLRYAEKGNMKDPFVPWKVVSHPDFSGKTVEVGGIRPFLMKNPPADSLDAITDRNSRFIMDVAGMHPEPELLDIKAENAGEGIWRISLKVHNKGLFATLPKISEENIYTRVMRITAEPSPGQEILSGRKVQAITRLEGGGSSEFSWLISGRGKVRITAGAVNTGSAVTDVELK